MTAVMTAESGNNEKIAESVKECEKMGIRVLPPDVNASLANFTYITIQEIRFGLKAIKNLGTDIIEMIIRERKKEGNFKSLEDFLRRVKSKNLNKKSLEALIKSGALDSLGERNQMLENMEKLLSFLRANQKEERSAQPSLFSEWPRTLTLRLDEISPASSKEKLAWEKEYLGLYVSGHPFSSLQRLVENYVCPVREVLEFERRGRVWLAGTIGRIQKVFTKSGDLMLFVTIEDLSGQIELLVFPKVLKETSAIWQEDESIICQGDVSDKDGLAKILVQKAFLLSPENIQKLPFLLDEERVTERSPIKAIKICLTSYISKETSQKLKEILVSHPGQVPVYLSYSKDNHEQMIETKLKISYTKEVVARIDGLLGRDSIRVVI
jgi:DNA polymerase-3 subunit alpha